MKQIYKNKAEEIMLEIVAKTTMTMPGGLPHLFLGNKVSTASIWIKVGRNFEKWFKFVVQDSGMKLLPDGIIKNVIGKKSKDIDLLFVNEKDKTIHYRELKSNLELDTEKLNATYTKIKKIKEYLSKTYPDFSLDVALMSWAVYEKNDLPKKYETKIKECNSNEVDVVFPIDLFKLINADISKESYYEMFRNLAEKYL
jgi:hypothetical protein